MLCCGLHVDKSASCVQKERILVSMDKQTAAFSVIILLFAVLVTGWTVSSFRAPQQPATVALSTPIHTEYTAGPVQIYHSAHKGVHTYTGMVTIPSCDEFSSEVSSVGDLPPRVELSFEVVHQPPTCGATSTTLAVPFSVSVSSGNTSKEPVVDSVKVNDIPTTFSVIEY